MKYEIINIDTIHQSMMGNQELIQQLVDLFLLQSPIDLEALEDAINENDQNLIRERAHHIKPTMQYIGAIDLLNQFQNLENKAKANSNIEETKAIFSEIKPKFEKMIQELKSLSIN